MNLNEPIDGARAAEERKKLESDVEQIAQLRERWDATGEPQAAPDTLREELAAVLYNKEPMGSWISGIMEPWDSIELKAQHRQRKVVGLEHKMTRILKIGSILLILIAGWVGVELAFAIHELRIATVEIKQDVREIKQNANGVLIQAGLVLDQARQLAETQQDVAKKTAANTERLTREGAEALVRFNVTIDKVNNELIPQMQKTLETANLQIQNTGEEAANTLAVTRKGLEATLAETARVASSLNDVVSDPAIKASLQNIEAASKDGAEGVKEVKGAVTDVHEMTTDVKVAVKRATKPANLAFKILSWLWDKAMGAKVAF